MTNIVIDIDKHEDWPMFSGWLSEVIAKYEKGLLEPKMSKENGEYKMTPPNEAAIATRLYPSIILSDSLADSAERTVELSSQNVVLMEANIGDSVSNDPTGDSATDKIIKWFDNCYQCDSRIRAALDMNFGVPEFLSQLINQMEQISNLLSRAIGMMDSAAIRKICSMIALGDWCVQDLLALRAMLETLINQYFMLNIQTGVNWFDLIMMILRPILEALLALVAMGLQAALGPIECIRAMLVDLNNLVERVANTDASVGVGFTLDDLVDYDGSVSTADLRSGSLVIDYADVLDRLSFTEIARLAIGDFETRLKNLVTWLSSKLAVFNTQHNQVFLSAISIANVILQLRRLWAFVDALINLISNGRQACTQDADGVFIPAAPFNELFFDTHLIPDWVEFIPFDDEESAATKQPPWSRFTIIDSSLGTKHAGLGCLGRVPEKEKDQIEKWMKELDSLSLE